MQAPEKKHYFNLFIINRFTKLQKRNYKKIAITHINIKLTDSHHVDSEYFTQFINFGGKVSGSDGTMVGRSLF